MLRPDTLALTLLLALLTALGPLSMDLYLPSLPAIGRDLAADPAAVQLTISLYLIGFGAGQIVYGPLADRYGRKPVMLAALVIFAIATVIKKKLEEDLVPPRQLVPELSARVNEAIMRALKADRSQRQSSVQEFIDSLRGPAVLKTVAVRPAQPRACSVPAGERRRAGETMPSC